MAIEVIEWKDDSGREMVWRFTAGGEIKLGAPMVAEKPKKEEARPPMPGGGMGGGMGGMM